MASLPISGGCTKGYRIIALRSEYQRSAETLEVVDLRSRGGGISLSSYQEDAGNPHGGQSDTCTGPRSLEAPPRSSL
jgi:hypothetical protein